MKISTKALLATLTLVGAGAVAHAHTTIDTSKPIKVAMVPKLVGLSVFKANEKGAEMVAKKLNIHFLYTGPVTASAQGQVDIIKSLIARHFNVITITANDPTEPAPALERAMRAGIKVISYDSDVAPAARDFFIQDTSYPAIGKAMVESIAKAAGPDAKVAILSSTPDATIQNAWLDAVRSYMKAHYPKMKILTTQYGYSSASRSLAAGLNILQAYPDVNEIIAPDNAAEVGAAAAVVKLHKKGKVFVTGTSDPNAIRQYVKSGVIPEGILWNEKKQGELIMYVARLAANNAIKANGSFTIPGLGHYTIKNKVIVFSKPLIFTAKNVDKYHF